MIVIKSFCTDFNAFFMNCDDSIRNKGRKIRRKRI
jgi:hypothetical protein